MEFATMESLKEPVQFIAPSTGATAAAINKQRLDFTAPRDRWGRPKLLGADGVERAYMRATTLAGALEDKSALIDWKARVAAKGMTLDPNLPFRMSVVDINDPIGKRNADDIVRQACDLAGGSSAAADGTALHAVREADALGTVLDTRLFPAWVMESMRAVKAAHAQHGWTPIAVEVFVAHDEIGFAGTGGGSPRWELGGVAGTADAFGYFADVEWAERHGLGGVLVEDLKSGKSMEYGQLEKGIQGAIYAHGSIPVGPQQRVPLTALLFNIDLPAGVRREINLESGIITHAPAGQGTAVMLRNDIATGWKYAALAAQAYAARKVRGLLTELPA